MNKKSIQFNKEIKIAENDKFIFYKNAITQDFKDGYKIVLTKEKKTGYKEYLLIYNNKPIYSSQQIENLWNKRETLKTIEELNNN